MPVVLLLLVIILILLGGGGLILGLMYGLFVLFWAAFPWVVGIIAILFVVSFLTRSRGIKPTRRQRHNLVGTNPPPSSSKLEQPLPSHVRGAIERQRIQNEEFNARVKQAREKRGL